MQPSPQIDPMSDLRGVVELARMQIAMQRELTALRTQKFVLTQQQMSGADHQATMHLSAELREARTQISVLRQDIARLQQALDQAQGSLTKARKVAETEKGQMARDTAKYRARCKNLQGVINDIKRSWSWRIGNGIVRMARFLSWPIARPRRAPRSRTPA